MTRNVPPFHGQNQPLSIIRQGRQALPFLSGRRSTEVPNGGSGGMSGIKVVSTELRLRVWLSERRLFRALNVDEKGMGCLHPS